MLRRFSYKAKLSSQKFVIISLLENVSSLLFVNDLAVLLLSDFLQFIWLLCLPLFILILNSTQEILDYIFILIVLPFLVGELD